MDVNVNSRMITLYKFTFLRDLNREDTFLFIPVCHGIHCLLLRKRELLLNGLKNRCVRHLPFYALFCSQLCNKRKDVVLHGILTDRLVSQGKKWLLLGKRTNLFEHR